MTTLTACPKCDAQLPAPAEACPRCGIIFSKWAARSAERAAAMAAHSTPTPATPMPAAVSESYCQSCRKTGPTADVHFRQNIGMVLARQYKSIQGRLCRDCASKHFWKMTLTTLAVGWLGYISIVVAPFFIVMNLISYARAKFA